MSTTTATDTGTTTTEPLLEARNVSLAFGSVQVQPQARLVLTEGNYLLLPDDPWPAVAEALDEVWFCALHDETRRTRLVSRHVTFGKAPAAADWVRDVDEPNARLIAASPTRAHLVVDDAILETIGSPPANARLGTTGA